jgi:hypothetical protein
VVEFGYLKTEENVNNRGYIPRPTDQRLKFGILFQDFMPVMPNVKIYLNLVYNTGLPGGSPSYADPYVYQSRLRDYRRADVGFSYVLTEKNKGDKRPEGHWLRKFQDFPSDSRYSICLTTKTPLPIPGCVMFMKRANRPSRIT